MNFKDQNEHQVLLARVASLEKTLAAALQRIETLEAKRAPGRPKQEKEAA